MEIKILTKEQVKQNFQRSFQVTFLGFIVLSFIDLRDVRAEKFLGTIGISTAVGAVLGASTLPFYEQPTDHLSNIAIGAAVGAVFGLGIWAYGSLIGSPSRSYEGAGLKIRFLSEPELSPENQGILGTVNANQLRSPNRVIHSRSKMSAKTTLDLYTPLVSLSW